MEVIDAKGIKELRGKLYECKHPISTAGARVLEYQDNPIAVMLEIIQKLAAHASELEDLATKRVELAVPSMVIRSEDVVTEMPSMESTTVYASKEQMIALRGMSKRTGVPMAEYIRRGIDLILKETEERLGDSPKVVASS